MARCVAGATRSSCVEVFICPRELANPRWRLHRPMSLRIVHYNESVLHRKGVKIEKFDHALAQLAKDMIEAMHGAAGIGLAAQQIGRAIQLCVVDLREAEA